MSDSRKALWRWRLAGVFVRRGEQKKRRRDAGATQIPRSFLERRRIFAP
jgi:hypothetical protein